MVLPLDPRLITMLQSPNGEQRLFVPRAGFPDLLVDTLIATEDRHFYEHDGISPYSGIRADAIMLIEMAIFGGDQRIDQQIRETGARYEESLFTIRRLQHGDQARIEGQHHRSAASPV